MKPLFECRLLVTPTSFGKDDPRLRSQLEATVGAVRYNSLGRPLTSAELTGLIQDVDGYIAGVDVIDRNVLQKAVCLKVISRYGVGVDSIDLEAARERGIVVTNTPGANSASVAELVIGLILSVARNIPRSAQATKSGEWPRLSGVSLDGKIVGLVGFGAIGRQVARRLAGFGCSLLVFDPVVAEARAAELGAKLLPLSEVISQSDFVSLHCPLTNETRALVNAEFIREMKTGAYLINTARGELVDEQALLEGLRSGKLRGAGLDVFSRQPPDPGDPLLSLPQVVLTPHMGAHTDGATNAMGWRAMNDCLAVLRGEDPVHRIV